MKEYLALIPEEIDNACILLSSEGDILVKYNGASYRVSVTETGEFELPPELDYNHPVFQAFLTWAFEKGLLGFEGN